ncbi:hypothetical protein K1719_018670 [Acacia pycnantha]|nr:hypothetical protein K1719_018670 [Acacia pycnantha]
MSKTILERLVALLKVSKGQIMPVFKEKMASCEKQIIYFINTNRRERAMSSMQSGQLPPHHMQLASQPQSQLAQIQSHENQVNPQMQSTNLQSSVATMPQSSMASLQHNSIPSNYIHEPLPHQAKSKRLEKAGDVQNNIGAPRCFTKGFKGQIMPVFKEKMASCEKQIIYFINTNRRERAMSSMQSGQLPPHHMRFSRFNRMIGKSGGDDWQEEVFQKIKSMKESYLPELTETLQKTAANLQLHEPLPHQAKSKRLEKAGDVQNNIGAPRCFTKGFKGQIMPVFKEKWLHLASQPQSQLAQIQSHENQVNPQMQSTNLQSSVATMPQSSMASLQHNSIPSNYIVDSLDSTA